MLLLTFVFLARLSSAMDFTRLAAFYERGCQADLDAAPGLRTAAGALAARDATPEELDLGLRILRRRVQTEPLGNHTFAAFLFDLSSEREDDLLESLFLEYLQRPGNEALLGDFVEDIASIVYTHVLHADVSDDVTHERLRLLIKLVRDNPARQGPVWDEVMDKYLSGEVVDAERVLDQIEYDEISRSDAVDLVAEMKREFTNAVPDLRLWSGRRAPDGDDNKATKLITGLRLDIWVREETGLPTPPKIFNIIQRIGLIGQGLTHH